MGTTGRAWEPVAEAAVQVVGQVHPHQHPRGRWVDGHVVLRQKPRRPQGPWEKLGEKLGKRTGTWEDNKAVESWNPSWIGKKTPWKKTHPPAAKRRWCNPRTWRGSIARCPGQTLKSKGGLVWFTMV